MALSGSFHTSAWVNSRGDQITAKFSWTAVQSIEGNYSDISWQLVGSRSESGYVTAGGFRVKIDGETVYSVTDRINLYNGTRIASGTRRIYHSDSGEGSFAVSVEAGIYYGWYLEGTPTVSGSQRFQIEQIPRGAVLLTAPDFTDEENPAITYTNPAGSAVTSIQACICDEAGQVVWVPYRDIPVADTSYTFALTDTERKALRNATLNSNTLKLRFGIKTVIGGSTQYSVLHREMTVVNALPTLSAEVRDINPVSLALTGDENILVQQLSTGRAAASYAGRKGANVVSYQVSCAGVVYRDNPADFSNMTSGEFAFSVTDSRGNTHSLPVRKTLIPYLRPTCSLENNRIDGEGNLTFVATGKWYSGSFGAKENTLSVQYRYMLLGGSYSDWMDMELANSGEDYIATAQLDSLDYKAAYLFQARATDLVGSAVTPEQNVKSFPVFDWGENDFNFNVPVFLQGAALADFVVEQGTTGSWTWRKWNSGIAECWGNPRISSGEWSGSNGIYYTPENRHCSFPAQLFTAVGTVNLNVSSAGGAVVAPATATFTTTGISMHFIRAYGGTDDRTLYLSIYAVGRWKE